MPGTRPPYGTQFFCFCIHFHQKVPTSEVQAPLMGACPPMENPGSATAYRSLNLSPDVGIQLFPNGTCI